MEDLAKRYAEGAHFLFVYTREAHPGEFYPPHQYYEQKLLHAASFRERLGVERTIVVDSLQGKVHRIFGGVSNMSWIVDHTGRVAYRAAWTVADDIERALQEVLAARELKRNGEERRNVLSRDDRPASATRSTRGPAALHGGRCGRSAVRGGPEADG